MACLFAHDHGNTRITESQKTDQMEDRERPLEHPFEHRVAPKTLRKGREGEPMGHQLGTRVASE